MFKTREITNKELDRTIRASIQTDVGCVRDENQDSGTHIIPGDEELVKKRGSLTVVADGMGGHAAGEVASQMAVELISDLYYADTESSPQDALKKAIETANLQIFEQSTGNEKFFGMGTTVIALAILEKTAFSAHVGDSRLYRLNGRTLELLTIDHSQVMEMVKEGIISFEQAQTHEDKNIILRALGTQSSVEVEVSEAFEVGIGNEFLLCSDGLCDMLEDSEIEKIWAEAGDIHNASQSLIEASKSKGGEDNITVGIVRIAAQSEEAMKRKNIKRTREIEVSAQ